MTNKPWVLIPAVLALSLLGGCNILGYFGYLIAPEGPTKKVEAEFDGLEGHSVAVVIYSDQKVQFEHPWAASELSHTITEELREQVKHITVLDPKRVLKYQAEHVRWDTIEKTSLGKDLDVDFVLYVTLIEFATRQPGAMHLYQGHIVAEASIWDVSQPERQGRVWYAGDLAATHPDTPVGQLSQDDREIRYNVERLFAEKLAKKFYKHKVPKEP